MSTRPTTFAEAEDVLVQNLFDYEPRPQQQALALAIEDAFDQGRHLIAEAGTGTGKSLGYNIDWTVQHRPGGAVVFTFDNENDKVLFILKYL